MNIAMLLEMVAAAMPERTAVGPAEPALTFQRLMGHAAGLAGRVRAAKAEHVVLCDEPGPILPVAMFGAGWAGVPYVPLNYRLSDDELRALAQRASPALAIADKAGARRLAGIAGVEAVASDEIMRQPDGAASPAAAGDWSGDGDTVAALLYTSGTTGAPKAAVLRHRHLVSYVLTKVEFASARPDESHLMSVPPYHIASVVALVSQLYAGRPILALRRFDADDWIALARERLATHAMLVPTMLTRIVDSLARRGETLDTIRELSYGGGPAHMTVLREALERFPNAAFTNAYGLTETSATVSVLGPREHREAAASADPAVSARLASAGMAMPGVEISIRDPATGRPARTGAAGEIWVRGEQVSGEYREHGSLLDENGWFCTRDRGRFDADGYLYVLGRDDDIIVRGGENISPGEVEDALLSHPGVTDAAAFGVASREWGETVVAAVVTAAAAPAPSEAELRATVQRRLRSSRVPERIEFVDELPYNDTGKILRRVLRERFAAGRAPDSPNPRNEPPSDPPARRFAAADKPGG